jgi:hypothetical protein
MFADELNALATRELLKDRHSTGAMIRGLKEMFRDEQPVCRERLQTPCGMMKLRGLTRKAWPEND